MLVRVFTLAFSSSLAGFDDRKLRDFIGDKEMVSIRDHFFLKDELPYMAVVVTYNLLRPPNAAPVRVPIPARRKFHKWQTGARPCAPTVVGEPPESLGVLAVDGYRIISTIFIRGGDDLGLWLLNSIRPSSYESTRNIHKDNIVSFLLDFRTSGKMHSSLLSFA